jgi:hypothetical protein
MGAPRACEGLYASCEYPIPSSTTFKSKRRDNKRKIVARCHGFKTVLATWEAEIGESPLLASLSKKTVHESPWQMKKIWALRCVPIILVKAGNIK